MCRSIIFINYLKSIAQFEAPWALSMRAWAKCLAICPQLHSENLSANLAPSMLYLKPIENSEVLEEAKKSLESIILTDPLNSLHRIRLAKLYWILGGI